MRTVFHVETDDVDEQVHALASVDNLLADETATLDDVAVVVKGDAVEVVTTHSANASRVRSLLDDGVSFRVCGNSLDERDVPETHLLDSVERVSSAVTELTRLQDAGYAYIRL